MGINRVELVGGLTRDPEFRITPTGTSTWFATVAVNGSRYDSQSGGQVVKTTYVALSAFGWMAEQLYENSYVKGEELHIVGELDQYEVEKDGQKDRKTRVTPLVVTPIRRRSEAMQQQRGPQAQKPDPWAAPPREEPPF